MNAQFSLALAYESGTGVVAADLAEATRWFLRAANQGDVPSARKVAGFYEAGTAVPQNFEEAVRWHTVAATKGDVFSLERLGDLYWALGRQDDARGAWQQAQGRTTEQAALDRLQRKQAGQTN